MISDSTLRRVIRSESLVALVGDLVRSLLAVMAVAIVALYLLHDAALARVMFHDLHMNDFGKFFYSTLAFLDGAEMYGPNPATAIPVGMDETREFTNMNPPHFHLLLLPIARLEPLAALIIWTTASLLALAASLRIITRELSIRWTPAGLLWALVAFLICSATETMIITGQVTFILLLPFTLAWVAARRGSWTKAAIYMGLVASIKPFLAILGVYLLVRRQVRAAFVMVAVAASCLLLGIAVFGWTAQTAWLNALGSVEWEWALMNASLHGPLARGLSESPFFRPLTLAPEYANYIGAAASVVVILIALTATARDGSSQKVDRAFALLTVTALLASPLGWIYYLWLALAPLVALWITGSLRRWPVPGLVMAFAAPGFIYPLQFTLAGGDHRWAGVTVGSIYTWSLLLIWIAVLLSSRSTAQRSTVTVP